MNNPRLTSLVVLICSLFAVVARGEWPIVDVLNEGSGNDYWVCIVREDASSQADAKPVTSSLRQRIDPVAGKWDEIAGLQSRIIDITAVGNDLAALTHNGDWKLFHKGGGAAEGQSLPAPYRPIRFGGDGQTLYAIAIPAPRAAPATTTTAPATLPADPAPAIFQFIGSSWKQVAELPGIDARQAAIGAGGGAVYLASNKNNTISVDRVEGDALKHVLDVPANAPKTFKLLHSASQLRLAWQAQDGAWSVASIGDDATVAPKPLPAHLPSDVTFVGTTLRLAYADGAAIKQLSIDQYGLGDTFGPDEIAQIPRSPQALNNWMQVVVLVLLTITMLITLRQRPGTASELPDASKLQLAPLGRRVAAGVIDLFPLIAAIAFTSRDGQGHMTLQGMLAAGWVVYVGFLVYVVHTTTGEAIYGRSIGKYFFGLRVVGYDGQRVPAGRIILRNLMRMLDVTLFYIPLFLLMFTPLRQRVGDLAARTIVIIDEPAEADDSESSAD